jgi:hypothetical protein
MPGAGVIINTCISYIRLYLEGKTATIYTTTDVSVHTVPKCSGIVHFIHYSTCALRFVPCAMMGGTAATTAPKDGVAAEAGFSTRPTENREYIGFTGEYNGGRRRSALNCDGLVPSHQRGPRRECRPLFWIRTQSVDLEEQGWRLAFVDTWVGESVVFCLLQRVMDGAELQRCYFLSLLSHSCSYCCGKVR